MQSKVMRRFTYLFVVVLAAAGLAAYFVPDWMNAPAEQGYRLGRVDRGEIVASVNATGAINPTTTVIVGSQLSGQVVEILVDFNSEVKAGQVVARLNSDQIRAKLDAARADLEQMQATRMVQEGQILRAQADIEKARAARTDMEAQVARNASLLEEAERNFSRQSDLRQRQISAEATFDTSRTQRDAQRSALASARAQLLSSEASIKSLDADLQIAQAQLKAVTAQVAQREAAVRQIEVDIRNSEIKSPVNGVIVQRNVELGQTVAASLQAPTLFLIADDLHRMEISASIDEADVGRIKPGQKASFTVNAFPGRTFEGEVKLVRLGSQTVQNVVIYTAIIAIDNPRLELLPGMTANLRVETDRREDVLRLPNAALRFRPAGAAPDAAPLAGAPEGARGGGGQQGGRSREFANAVRSELKLSADQTNEVDAAFAEMRTMFAGAAESDPASRREQFRAARRALEERIAALLTPEQKTQFDAIRARFDESPNRGQSGRIYVLGSDNKPQAVNVRLGASDGGQTEIVTGDIKAGQDVIIGGGPRAPETRPTGPRFGF